MLRRHFIINIDSGIPKDEIWYTSSDSQVIPNDTTVFGANYLPDKSTFDSNTGKGILKFDGSVTNIGDSAFYYCSLDFITIPNSVKNIGKYAFDSSNLSSIIIPNSVKNIGECAFEYCGSLQSVIIGNGVTSIKDGTFSCCDGLSSIIIGNNVENIGGYAFFDCFSLTSITIPNGVKNIGYAAFSYCSSLTSIIYEGTISQWNAITKETNWNGEVPTTVVHCIDGDVEI